MKKFHLIMGMIVFFVGFILLISFYGYYSDAEEIYDSYESRSFWTGSKIPSSVENHYNFWKWVMLACGIIITIGIVCVSYGVFNKEKETIFIQTSNKKFYDTGGSPMSINNKFCSECGQKLASNSKFCNNCGKKVIGGE